MSDNQSEKRNSMSLVESLRTEMQEKVYLLARPTTPGESVKSCIRRVAKKSRLSFGQVRRIWYAESRRPPGDVVDSIRDAVRRHEAEIDREYSDLKARYWSLVNQSSDPEFYAQRVGEVNPPTDRLG